MWKLINSIFAPVFFSSYIFVGVTEIARSGTALGPLGWIVLGASSQTDQRSWDCWKQILHETSSSSSQPSRDDTAPCVTVTKRRGILLKDLVDDARVRSAKILLVPISESEDETAGAGYCDGDLSRSRIILENVWGEMFNVDFVALDDGRLAAHASRI
jgi:hypothetical protein